jgi:tetratricopeptide (TPR) repeat protein
MLPSMLKNAARRYLLGAVALPLTVGILGLVAVLGPWTPLALDRANARYTAGDVAGAEEAYAALMEGWSTPATRAEAATRAGLLALARGDAGEAAERLRRAVDLHPDAERRAAVRIQLAGVYRDQLSDPARAAEEYERAVLDADGAATLVAAATCWERAGRIDRAVDAWMRAVNAPGDDAAREQAEAGLLRAERSMVAVVDAEP